MLEAVQSGVGFELHEDLKLKLQCYPVLWEQEMESAVVAAGESTSASN